MRKKNFELRTDCEVLRVNRDNTGKRATGVTYVDVQGREFEQPAELVILCAYALHNVRLMLLSGIGQPYDPRTGQGVVGKNYAYQIVSGVDVFFDDKVVNPFVGAGALGMGIDEYNGDNFDHSGLGFIGGGYLACWNTNGRPIEHHPTPKGTPNWGTKWKQAVAKNYLTTVSISTHGAVMSHRTNYLDLDPTYRDVHGQPLMRLTFDFTDNEHRMSDYLTDRAAEIAKAMKPREIHAKKRAGHYSIVPYQTTHNTGGAIMGGDPKSSAVNRYLQSWDVSNLFVMGACAFPQNAGYNPTGTVGALTYWAADAIKQRISQKPGSVGASLAGGACAHVLECDICGLAGPGVRNRRLRIFLGGGHFVQQRRARSLSRRCRRLRGLPHRRQRQAVCRRPSSRDAVWRHLFTQYHVRPGDWHWRVVG